MFQKGGSLFCDMTANHFDSVLLQQKILLVDNLNGFFEPLEQPVFKCYVAQWSPTFRSHNDRFPRGRKGVGVVNKVVLLRAMNNSAGVYVTLGRSCTCRMFRRHPPKALRVPGLWCASAPKEHGA